jgi:Tol biopolymer transport system component
VSDYKVVVGDDGEIESDDLDLYEKPKRKRKPFRRPIRLFIIVVVSGLLLILSSVGVWSLYYFIQMRSLTTPILNCGREVPQIAVGGSSIAFQVKYGDNGNDTFISAMDGRNPIVANETEEVDSLDLSYDQAWIVESRRHVIYSWMVDSYRTHKESRLTEGNYPAWSPDGSQIAFFRISGRHDNRSTLYIMNANGMDIRPVTDTFLVSSPPSWSPDGSQLLFSMSSDTESTSQRMYMVDVDGTDLRMIIDNGLTAEQPSWSPDGKRIAYVSHDIYTINLDGSDRRNLTDSQFERVTYPQWSPDSQNLVFLGYTYPTTGIYMIDEDGEGLHSLYTTECPRVN